MESNEQKRFDFTDETSVRKKIKSVVDIAPLDEIVELIEAEIANETQIVNFHYEFKCFLEDGAYALHKAVNELQGFSTQGNDGPSAKPPTMIDVTFADGSSLKVPYGRINIPGLTSEAYLEMGYAKLKRLFSVQGTCENRHVDTMNKIVKRAMAIIATDSIYRGQAIILDSDLKPKFLDLEKGSNIKLYLNSSTKFDLVPILTRIEQTNKYKALGKDLKTGAVFAGGYGTGKTLLAFDIARRAVKNDWSFIYLKDPHKTKDLLEIANELSSNGNGSVTFVEDIDLIMKGERDAKMNEILNILDGGDTKGNPVISIFTTNHLEKIDSTFMRGKRIGNLVTLRELDREASNEMILGILGDKLERGSDLTEVIDLVDELKIVPAFMAEIIERALSHSMISESQMVTTKMLKNATVSYKNQIELARVTESVKPITIDNIIGGIVEDSINGLIDKIEEND